MPHRRRPAVAHAADEIILPDGRIRYTGQRLANDPWLDALRDAALEFWRRRNVEIPVVPDIYVASDLSGPETPEGDTMVGRGWDPNVDGEGIVALYDDMVGRGLARARDEERRLRARRRALWNTAGVLLHEIGHVGGLDHDRIDPWGHGGTKRTTPRIMRAAIRDLIPMEARDRRRRRRRRRGRRRRRRR